MLKLQNKAKNQTYEHLLIKYHNLKRASILTSGYNLEYGLLGKGGETLFKLQQELTKDSTQGFITDSMIRLKRFIDIAAQTRTAMDMKRVDTYCDSLQKNNVLSFYEKKDG